MPLRRVERGIFPFSGLKLVRIITLIALRTGSAQGPFPSPASPPIPTDGLPSRAFDDAGGEASRTCEDQGGIGGGMGLGGGLAPILV